MAIALPERLSLEAILSQYCESRVPVHVRDKVRMTFRVEGSLVTLFEQRPRFDNPAIWLDLDIARFRYVARRNQWELFWRDSNGRWHFYDRLRPSRSIEPLLAEVNKDPTGIFWG